MRSYFSIVGIFTVLPIPAFLLVWVLSKVTGCGVNEGGAGVCMIAGLDIGGFLYSVGLVAAWGWIITLPVGAALLIVGAIVAAFKEQARHRKS